MAHIQVIDYEESQGRLREIYDELIKSRGKLAEVHKIQSLNTETIVHHMELYLAIMFKKSPLKRYQREMIGVVVSAANKCEYCFTHHGKAVNHYWKDWSRVEALIENHQTAFLKPEEELLCQYAALLTSEPSAAKDGAMIAKLKEAGFTDRAILDTTLVVAYFNFVNRLVLGLGIDLEEDAGEGYNYD